MIRLQARVRGVLARVDHTEAFLAALRMPPVMQYIQELMWISEDLDVAIRHFEYSICMGEVDVLINECVHVRGTLATALGIRDHISFWSFNGMHGVDLKICRPLSHVGHRKRSMLDAIPMELIWHAVSWLDPRSLARACRVSRRLRNSKAHFDWFHVSVSKFGSHLGGGERRQRNHHALVHRTGRAVVCASMPTNMHSGMALSVVAHKGFGRVLYERGWCIDMQADHRLSYVIRRLHRGTITHISPPSACGEQLYVVDVDAADELHVYSTHDDTRPRWRVINPSLDRYEAYLSGACFYARENTYLVITRPCGLELYMRSCDSPNQLFHCVTADQSVSTTPWGIVAIQACARRLHFSHHESCFMYPMSSAHVACISPMNHVTQTLVADEYYNRELLSSVLTVYNVSCFPPQPIRAIHVEASVASSPVSCVGPCFMWREMSVDADGRVIRHHGDETYKPTYCCGNHYLLRGYTAYIIEST